MFCRCPVFSNYIYGSTNFYIKDAPEMLVAPSSTTVIEGNNVGLFCNATGNPQPNITWIKAGYNISLSSSETLRLENLTRMDDALGYKCKFMNYLGFVEASAVVTVHCKY